MNARYKVNDASENTDITSITFKRDEVDDLVAELESELEVESDKDEETETPAVAKLLRRLEELQGKFDDEADEVYGEGNGGNEEEEAEADDTHRIIKLTRKFIKDIDEV